MSSVKRRHDACLKRKWVIILILFQEIYFTHAVLQSWFAWTKRRILKIPTEKRTKCDGYCW